MRVFYVVLLILCTAGLGTGRVSSKGSSTQTRSTPKAKGSAAARHGKSRRNIFGGDDDGEGNGKRPRGHTEDDENSFGTQDLEDKRGAGDNEDNIDDHDDEEEESEETDEEDNEESTDFSRSRSTKKGALGRGVESATEFANMALKLTKGSVKAAVDLCANKHVTMNQIMGKWRIQQEIEVRRGVFISSPATIEFCDDGSVLTTCDGQEFKSEFTFKERAWPRKCTISFQARAFQGPRDPEPVAMFYKGYFKRSILNPNVVLIRGKVYRLSGKLFFKRQEVCGKFKAQKRRYSK